MWTTSYILSQISVVLAFVCLGITLLIKNRNAILMLGILSAVFFCIQYFLLGATMGAVVNIINVIRTVWYFIDEKRGKLNNLVSLITIITLFLIVGIIFVKEWLGVLAVFAGIIYAYSLWQRKVIVYRCLSTLVNLLWLIYDSLIFSLFEICLDCCFIVVGIIGIVSYIVKRRKLIS